MANDLFNIAAVVVLYNPDDTVFDKFQTYFNSVNFCYVVDNSTNINKALVEKFQAIEKVEYIKLDGNKGIANALNVGAKKALYDGFDFLLTMDQDSRVFPCMIESMAKIILKDPSFGILSPQHLDLNYNRYFDEEIEESIAVKTSGNLLNLNAFKEVGDFNEHFFIDYVDIEYCFRVIEKGYKVARVRDALLGHREANLHIRKYLGIKLFIQDHSPLRVYYKSRNRFYLLDKYLKKFPEYFQRESPQYRNLLIKIFLFEKQKFKKLYYAFLGYYHYKKQITGKFPNS